VTPQSASRVAGGAAHPASGPVDELRPTRSSRISDGRGADSCLRQAPPGCGGQVYRGPRPPSKRSARGCSAFSSHGSRKGFPSILAPHGRRHDLATHAAEDRGRAYGDRRASWQAAYAGHSRKGSQKGRCDEMQWRSQPIENMDYRECHATVDFLRGKTRVGN
jgi:hypothetical protein